MSVVRRAHHLKSSYEDSDGGAGARQVDALGLAVQAPLPTLPATTGSSSRARLRVLDLQRRELATDREVVVVEHQRARDAVLVKLERDCIDRELLAVLLLLGLVEIAHRDRPALHAGELLLVARGIVGDTLGPNLAADDGERVVDLLTAFRAIIDRQFEDALVVARRLENLPHMLGREDDGRLKVERLVLRLRQRDRDGVLPALGPPVDRVDELLIEVVLRGELIGLGSAVLPSGRSQVAQRDLAFAIVELRDLTELELVAVAHVAGEVIENTAARRDRAAFAGGSGKLELVDRAVCRQFAGWRQRRRRPGPAKQGGRRKCD